MRLRRFSRYTAHAGFAGDFNIRTFYIILAHAYGVTVFFCCSSLTRKSDRNLLHANKFVSRKHCNLSDPHFGGKINVKLNSLNWTK